MYKKELNLLKSKKRYRKREIFNGIDLASNDYLCLAENRKILELAYQKLSNLPHSSKASMLVNGYHPAHQLLEEYLKEVNNFEEALIVGNGFLANLALFELGRKGDVFLIDEEYHASGIVGSKLTQADTIFFKHNDFEDLKKIDLSKYNRVFVAVEGIYSMRGDKVDKRITEYAQKVGYLIIDEAHSVGICGKNLLGITEEYNLNPKKTIKMGTLGKALGSYGAYILANREIIEFLLNRAKSVIYTTALSPMDTLLGYFAFKRIEKNLDYFKREIEKRKEIFQTDSLIKIIETADNETLLSKKEELLKKNILIGAIRPPTVKSPIFRIILRTCIEIETIKNVIKELEC